MIMGKEGFREFSADHRTRDIFPVLIDEDRLPPMTAESLRTAFVSGSRSSVFPKGSGGRKDQSLNFTLHSTTGRTYSVDNCAV